jgi:hypothetical protein
MHRARRLAEFLQVKRKRRIKVEGRAIKKCAKEKATFQKAGDPIRATNLYRAASAGPLREVTRKDVERMLAECLAHLAGWRLRNAGNVLFGS